jgi:hypothetical protein
MVGEMFEDLPGNHYAEASHMREIALRLMARQVDLWKEHFPEAAGVGMRFWRRTPNSRVSGQAAQK